MKLVSLILASSLMALPVVASAAAIERVGVPTAGIAQMVIVPAGSDIAFVSGMTPGAPGQPKLPDTETQTFDILTKMQALLKTKGMSLNDVVVMRVFLGVDPAKDNHADRPGMNKAFAKFFGTAENPNKPARTTVAVTDMAVGSFVEIDAQAARAH